MTTIREQLETRERTELAPQAMKSADSQGRPRPEPEDPLRPAFQRDRDRIVHCKAFRRLKHKTQVFFSPAGDHYRTRLTHTLEVSQIARTIAKVLRLHEELTEAIALGHDLGHTPFGHAGERVLDALVPGGFNHYEQSLRVVDVLEGEGRAGLNLSWEVRNGIAKHSKGSMGCRSARRRSTARRPSRGRSRGWPTSSPTSTTTSTTPSAPASCRTGDLPSGPVAILGESSSQRIGRMVTDVVVQTLAVDVTEIRMSDDVLGAMLALRDFLFTAVYENDVATVEFKKAVGHPGRALGEGPRAAAGVPRDGDHRGGGAGCRRPRLRRRHDRPLRRPPLRAPVHPGALGRVQGVVRPRRRSVPAIGSPSQIRQPSRPAIPAARRSR